MALWTDPRIINTRGRKSYGGIFEASRKVMVYSTDYTTESEYVVIEGCGHSIGDAHPDAPNARVVSIEPVATVTTTIPGGPLKDQKALRWEVTLEYGPLSPLEAEFADNPLGMPPIWTWDGEFDEVYATVDRDGVPIVNSAYDPFDPPEPTRRYRGTLRARVNLPLDYVTIPGLAALSNKVNIDTVGDFPPNTLRSGAFTEPEPVYYPPGNYKFYPMVFDFEFNPDTWTRKKKDAGYRELGTDGKPQKILDKKGQEIDEPAFLDGSGHKLEPPFEEGDTQDISFDLETAISFLASFPFLGTDWRNT